MSVKLIYSRVSKKDAQTVENQLYSITQQHPDCAMWFSDEVTGKSKPLNRPGFSKLYSVAVKMAEQGVTPVIVVTGFDRLSRDTITFLTMLEEFSRKGIVLLSLRENIDTTTAQGYLMATQFISWATYERQLISERTQQALSRLKSEGKPYTRVAGEASREATRLLESGKSVADVIVATNLSRAMVYRLKSQISL